MTGPKLPWGDDPAQAAEQLREAIEAFSRHADPQILEWLVEAAEEAAALGLQPIAKEVIHGCRRSAERLSDDAVRHQMLARIGNVEGLLALQSGQYNAAAELLLASVQDAQLGGSRFAEALAHQNLATALSEIGEADSAREHALLALRLYEEFDDRLRQAQMLVNLANYDLTEGRPDAAREHLDRAQVLATGTAAAWVRTSILGTRAAVARALGDLEAAGAYHRRVIRRVRRGETLGHTRMAAQNMGTWYAETGKPRLASLWLGRAGHLALQEGNPSLAAGLLRSQAIHLMQAGALEGAEEVMRSATSISDEADDLRGAAEGRADLAAILLTAARNSPRTAGGNQDGFDEADQLLQSSLSFFMEVGDGDWTVRVQNNRISLSLLRGDPADAINRLVAARDALGPTESVARLVLDRRGLELSLTQTRRPDLAASFARDAAELAASGQAASKEQVPGRPADDRPSGSAAAAWELALGGALLRDFPFARPQAIALLLEAQELAGSDDSMTFHITNDLGLTYEESGDREAAIGCFDRCLEIAARRDDRYMRQQALANRGEMARRKGAAEARSLIQEAVDLARDLLDGDAEAFSLLNLAWCHIDRGNLISAEQSLDQLETLIGEGRSGDTALSKVESVRGRIAFGREDYEQSYTWHMKAASHATDTDERLGAMASALRPLTKMGDRQRYRRLLDRIIRDGQRASRDGLVAELIAPYGAEWIARGAVRMAGRTLADAILLGLNQSAKDAASHRDDAGASDDPAVLEDQFGPLITPVVQVNASIASHPELRPRLMREVFSRVRRQLPEESGDFISSRIEDLVDNAWAPSPAETDPLSRTP